MDLLKYKTIRLINKVRQYHRLMISTFTIMLFILAASAPNATIGIGK